MARSADRLIAQIRSDIRDGVLKPGDQLEEAALAERFGVSRTPVREAVRSLVDCGLLEMKSRKGAIVRLMSAKEVVDLFEVAAELEGMACRLAAQRLTEAQSEAIRLALDACDAAATAEDAAAYARANLAFHHAIHAAAANDRLIDQLAILEEHINPYRSMPYAIRGRLPVSADEHREIMERIIAGDGEAADARMRDHMMLQGERLPLVLRTLGD